MVFREVYLFQFYIVFHQQNGYNHTSYDLDAMWSICLVIFKRRIQTPNSVARGNHVFLRLDEFSGRFSRVLIRLWSLTLSEDLCLGGSNSRHLTASSQASSSTVPTQHGQSFDHLGFVVITWGLMAKNLGVPRD